MKIGDRHTMLKVIQHGGVIAKFRDLRENCWHCAWKFDRIGDRVILHVEKSSLLLVCPVFSNFQDLEKDIPTRIKMCWREQLSVAFALTTFWGSSLAFMAGRNTIFFFRHHRTNIARVNVFCNPSNSLILMAINALIAICSIHLPW